ncbi:MAG TPA: SIMPL domain-containing protein [Candidatus Hydrogenedentes bacterium]|nr:SIMPL domain-containing protein [Candidatus Hydrogenedentota bacterium]
MRHVIACACLLLCVAGGAALAQEQKPFRSISVSGTVEAKTAPDQIVWRIRLTDTNKDMRLAKTSNDQKVKSVVALRKKLGVDDADVETGQVSIRREYERGNMGPFKHFAVQRDVAIRQRDLKQFDKFLDALVSSAEMEASFSFESSRIHEVRAETRLKAIEAARNKAEAMAKAAGCNLGTVMTIREHAQDDRWQSPLSNGAFVQSAPAADLATETFVPGAITVQVTVYVTFELN